MISRLLRTRERRTYEITNLSLDKLADEIGITRSAAGSRVTESTALGSGPWFCAFDLVSSDVAAAGIFPYERLAPRGRQRLTDHPLYSLLVDLPNPEMSAFVFWKLMTYWKMGWGRGCAEIERDNSGRPLALWPIHPSRIGCGRLRGQLTYQVHNNDGQMVNIPAENILNFLGFTRDGVNGIGLIGLARESIGLTVGAEEYGARFFANDARPGVIIEIPGAPEDELIQSIRRSWITSTGGAMRHGVGILHSGMKATPFTTTNEDAQFLDTRKFQVTDASRFTHVAPYMLGELEGSKYATIEAQAIEYVRMAVLPHCKAIEQECSRKLLATNEKPKRYIRFELATLLRADLAARAAYLTTKRQNGALSADDWRELDDENPLPNGQGDIYLNPVNMEPAAVTAEKSRLAVAGVGVESPVEPEPDDNIPPEPRTDQQPQDPEPDDNREVRLRECFRGIFLSATERLARIESEKATRAVKNPDGYRDWQAKFLTAHRQRVRDELAPPIAAYREALAKTATPDFIDGAVERHLAALGASLLSADFDKLNAKSENEANELMETCND